MKGTELSIGALFLFGTYQDELETVHVAPLESPVVLAAQFRFTVLQTLCSPISHARKPATSHRSPQSTDD
jgi:hypothetical protein